jgi:hypothetical protein
MEWDTAEAEIQVILAWKLHFNVRFFLYLSALKNLSADPIMDPSTVTCTMLFLLNKIGFLIPGLELSYPAQQQNSQHYMKFFCLPVII